MKQYFPLKDLTISEIEFIQQWRSRKTYPTDRDLTIGEAIELLVGFSYNYHFEFSDGRFFNNILINDESVIGFDGNELIDILVFEARKAITKRMASASTFNEEVLTEGGQI